MAHCEEKRWLFIALDWYAIIHGPTPNLWQPFGAIDHRWGPTVAAVLIFSCNGRPLNNQLCIWFGGGLIRHRPPENTVPRYSIALFMLALQGGGIVQSGPRAYHRGRSVEDEAGGPVSQIYRRNRCVFGRPPILAVIDILLS